MCFVTSRHPGRLYQGEGPNRDSSEIHDWLEYYKPVTRDFQILQWEETRPGCALMGGRRFKCTVMCKASSILRTRKAWGVNPDEKSGAGVPEALRR